MKCNNQRIPKMHLASSITGTNGLSHLCSTSRNWIPTYRLYPGELRNTSGSGYARGGSCTSEKGNFLYREQYLNMMGVNSIWNPTTKARIIAPRHHFARAPWNTIPSDLYWGQWLLDIATQKHHELCVADEYTHPSSHQAFPRFRSTHLR